ncbi:MAG: hypothetical protein ACM31E_00440 [Fibrobacterota bacterium]
MNLYDKLLSTIIALNKHIANNAVISGIAMSFSDIQFTGIQINTLSYSALIV